MKDIKYFSISEFAKLKGTTAETLRHYNRVGLLLPEYIDPKNGYRYYSTTQSEKLGTILELRELGVSVEVIKDFFCNSNKSKEILEETYEKLCKQIKHLTNVEKVLKNKIQFFEDVTY